MTISTTIQNVSSTLDIPSESDIDDWIRTALLHTGRNRGELTLRIVNKEEITSLNRNYRDKNYPTDVLSFTPCLPADLPLDLLGDIVICADIVNNRAVQLNATTHSHWARIVTHGVLHLCGYDHEDSIEADKMEATELTILSKLGIQHPDFTDV